MKAETQVTTTSQAPTAPTSPPAAKVGILGLFRYADAGDISLMFIGTIFAMANGSALPLMTIFFGDIIQALVTYNGTPASIDAMDAAVRTGVLKMSLIGLATFICSYIQMFCWVIAGERQSKKIREAYFKSVVRQDVAWFDQRTTGELTNRLTSDLNLIQEGLSDKVGLLIQFSSSFVAGFIIGYTKGWQLALVVTSSLPFLAGSAFFLSKQIGAGSERSQKAYAGAANVAQQVLSSIRTVYSFSGMEKEMKRYAVQLDIAEHQGLRTQLFNGCGIGSIQFFVFCTYGMSFWYGNTLIPNTMNTGQVLNVLFAIIIGAFSLGNATPHIAAVGNALGACQIVYETIERKSPIDPLSQAGDKPESVQGEIDFVGINFHYPSRPDVPILENFGLKIKPGTTVALVGASGSGKSTIVKLFERFYDPSSGVVKLDGRDIKSLNVNWLRRQIGMVSQEPVLFDTTIRQNILYGYPDFEHVAADLLDKKIEHACRQANCWDFIQELPLRLETNVGESGGMLSGGQKQRIAIARAIIKNPPILLLDEATSALDTESERIVQAALEVASKDRTTIVIAHRLSTIQKADQIVVMEKGLIKEMGSHNELLNLGQIYASLVATQSLKSRNADGESDQNKTETVSKSEKTVLELADAGELNEKAGVVVLKESTEAAETFKLDYGRLLSWNRPEYWIFLLAGIGAALNGVAQPLFAILFTTMLT
ncbi:ATP-binding cassette, sub-B (MDR TAP), member 4, partial [Kappamyces sp. JEL0680]